VTLELVYTVYNSLAEHLSPFYRTMMVVGKQRWT